jgi:hypothetical protein
VAEQLKQTVCTGQTFSRASSPTLAATHILEQREYLFFENITEGVGLSIAICQQANMRVFKK